MKYLHLRYSLLQRGCQKHRIEAGQAHRPGLSCHMVLYLMNLMVNGYNES